MLTDPSGQWAVVDDAVALGGGFLTGVVGQGVGDLLSGHYSGWGGPVGTGMGGAAAGETLLYTGNPVLAGMAGGAVGNATTQGLRMASGAAEFRPFQPGDRHRGGRPERGLGQRDEHRDRTAG